MNVLSLCQTSVPFPPRIRLVEHEQLGIVPVLRHEGRVAELAEPATERDVLGRRDVLVAEEDDEVLEEGLLDRRDLVGRELLPEVDAGDLGADRRGERLDAQ